MIWTKTDEATASSASIVATAMTTMFTYIALMGITRGYGHSISGEFCTNKIDRFEAALSNMIFCVRGSTFTQECYCCGLLCIFPVFHALKSLMC